MDFCSFFFPLLIFLKKTLIKMTMKDQRVTVQSEASNRSETKRRVNSGLCKTNRKEKRMAAIPLILQRALEATTNRETSIATVTGQSGKSSSQHRSVRDNQSRVRAIPPRNMPFKRTKGKERITPTTTPKQRRKHSPDNQKF